MLIPLAVIYQSLLFRRANSAQLCLRNTPLRPSKNIHSNIFLLSCARYFATECFHLEMVPYMIVHKQGFLSCIVVYNVFYLDTLAIFVAQMCSCRVDKLFLTSAITYIGLNLFSVLFFRLLHYYLYIWMPLYTHFP